MELFMDEGPRIEEMVFFSTDKIDFYILMARERTGRYYLAGRFCSSPNGKKVFSLSGKDPKQLREKMVVMGHQIARLHDAHCAYVVFPLGVSMDEFLERLREAHSDQPLPWSGAAISKYFNPN